MMARMPIARATKTRVPTRTPASPRLGPLHLDDAPNAFLALINITRQQVQARGLGEIVLMNPGQIDGPKHRRCIQELGRRYAEKMYAQKKSALKKTSIQKARRLQKLAEALATRGVADAFFKALTRMYPELNAGSEWDRAAAKRQAVAAKNLYKRKHGQLPDERLSTAEVMALVKDDLAGSESVMGREDFDVFEGLEEPDISDLLTKDELDFDEEEDVALPVPARQLDNPEPDEEPEAPAAVRAKALRSDDAEVVAIKKILADQYGITSFKGRPGLPRLKEILAKAAGSVRSA